jgi:hypothetical protein
MYTDMLYSFQVETVPTFQALKVVLLLPIDEGVMCGVCSRLLVY